MALLLTVLSSVPCLAEPQVVFSAAKDRTNLSLTVYNRGFGMVRDERRITLPSGVVELRFADVPAEIEPTSVHVAVLEGLSLSVLEQNYEYELLSEAALMRQFLDRTVEIERQSVLGDRWTAIDRVAGTLLSAGNKPVFQVGGRIVAEGSAWSPVFPEVPLDLAASPTLVWRVEGRGAGTRRLETVYLTEDVTWSADYVLTLDDTEERAGLRGWVTLQNDSTASFEDARVQLVAGDVHRAEDRPAHREEYRIAAMAEAVTVVKEEPLFEYHLYTLPAATTISAQQTKQVEFLEAADFSVAKEYILHGAGSIQTADRGSRVPARVGVALKFRNSPAGGLGIALPAGALRAYKRDAAGKTQLVGEDALAHTPSGEDIRVGLGDAFDVTADRRQTDFRAIGDGLREAAHEIRIRNHKNVPVRVRVIEAVGGDWEMVRSSHHFVKTAAFEAEFAVPVDPGGETVLTYRVKVK